MNRSQIRDLTKKLYEGLSPAVETGEETMEEEINSIITDFFKGKVTETWTINDVQTFASEGHIGLELTDEQAQMVLDQLKRGYDASIGINWNVMETVIMEMQDEFDNVQTTISL